MGNTIDHENWVPCYLMKEKIYITFGGSLMFFFLLFGVRFASLRLFFVVSDLRIEEACPKYGERLRVGV